MAGTRREIGHHRERLLSVSRVKRGGREGLCPTTSTRDDPWQKKGKALRPRRVESEKDPGVSSVFREKEKGIVLVKRRRDKQQPGIEFEKVGERGKKRNQFCASLLWGKKVGRRTPQSDLHSATRSQGAPWSGFGRRGKGGGWVSPSYLYPGRAIRGARGGEKADHLSPPKQKGSFPARNPVKVLEALIEPG